MRGIVGVIPKTRHYVIRSCQSLRIAIPLLRDFAEESDWVEPDDVPRSIVAYGIASDTFGEFKLEPHHHDKSQLLLVQRGALRCETEGELWIVPPRSAIWIPGGAIHAVKITGALEGYAAFVAPELGADLPATCCAVSVTPLLRELLIRCASLPLFYEERGANARPMAVLLDEMASAKAENLMMARRPIEERWTAGLAKPA